MPELTPYLRDRYAMLFPEKGVEELTRPLPQSLRVNELRISRGELVQRLEERGFELEPVPWVRCSYRVVKAPFSPGATPEYLLGYYYLQDPASAYACEALEPRRGELVLDCAASPGGKTTYIAQLMHNTGCIVALEVKKSRLKALRANLNRMGVQNTLVLHMDARLAETLGLKFDRVLLDAPCTGTGTAHRNPEALQKTEEDIKRLTPLQLELLRSAYAVLRKGGTMVYSTCSYLPEENELLLHRFLQESRAKMLKLRHGSPGITSPYGIQLEPVLRRARRFYPWEHRTQGFFIAKMRKR